MGYGVVDVRARHAVMQDRLSGCQHSMTRKWLYVGVLVVASFVSRIPQLLSPNLLVDGDECVVGLMAKHVAQGKELPTFFYGQHYGFSSVEAIVGAVGFLVLGVGPVPLKLAMLALWTTGVVFLFLAVSRLLGTGRAFWIAIVLLLTPAWAVWSMKARGGYLTAFTATAILLWLLVRERESLSLFRWLLAGVLTTLIYLAQPLWLPGLLPILAIVLISHPRSHRKLYATAAYLTTTLTTVAMVRTWGGAPLGNRDLLGSVPRVARQIYVSLTGSYYLWWAIDPPGPATKTLAFVWCALFVAAVGAQVYRLLTHRWLALSHVLFLSILSTIVAGWLLLPGRDARYLLPLSALLVLLVGVEIVDFVDRRILPERIAVGFALTMLALGSVSMHEFRRFTYLWNNGPSAMSEARRLRQVINALETRDARRAFSMNGLLEWQLMFYSNEDVMVRSFRRTDRYPLYVSEVEQALLKGEPLAIVGYTNTSGAPGCQDVPVCTGDIEHLVANPESIFTVDDKYFVYVGARRDVLERLHFRLPEN